MRKWTGNHRSRVHDYSAKGIYHITMMKARGVETFGSLAGDYRLPAGTLGSSYIQASPTGRAIKDALRLLPQIHPALRLYQYALMPDHLHLIVAVEAPLDEPIGRKLARLKRLAAGFAGLDSLFESGFNDQILKPSRSLDVLYRYLRENPWRLAVRRANPDFFRRNDNIQIGGTTFQAYGNIQLLDNPFKEQVVVHRADTPEVRESNRAHWLYTAANGGVLVSPFISADERAVRAEAETYGGRIILLRNEPLDERGKPAAADFDLCCEGSLLILTPLSPQLPKSLSRECCLAMNALAEEISLNDAA